jgi:hypothetical protein
MPLPIAGKIDRFTAPHRQRCYAAHLISIRDAAVNVVAETRFTPQAAERLKAMLSKLGKSAYEIAIKIISDIGSATVKKMLGL